MKETDDYKYFAHVHVNGRCHWLYVDEHGELGADRSAIFAEAYTEQRGREICRAFQLATQGVPIVVDKLCLVACGKQNFTFAMRKILRL